MAPGTLYGTPYATAIGEAYRGFGEQQLSRIGEMIMREREGARRMLPYLPTMTALREEAPLRRAEAATRIGALPRVLKQAELSAKIEEFIRTTPELSPVLSLALQLLNTTTQAAYYRPYQPSPFMQALQAAAPAIGAYYGAGGAAAAPTYAGYTGPTYIGSYVGYRRG